MAIDATIKSIARAMETCWEVVRGADAICCDRGRTDCCARRVKFVLERVSARSLVHVLTGLTACAGIAKVRSPASIGINRCWRRWV